MRDGPLRDLVRLLGGHLHRRRDPRLQDLAAVLARDSARGGWVLTAVNGSLRIRRAAATSVALAPRRIRSRLAYRAVPDGSPRHRLSLLCPTRGRVDRATVFLRSLDRTAAAGDRVEVLFYVDDDDPALEGYRRLVADASRRFPGLGAVRLHVGPPQGVPAAWNVLAELATGEFLMMANDDQVYVDYAWDVRLDRRAADLLARHTDGVLCLYFDAGQYPDGACDFPVVSRSWYERLGYFVPTIFEQWEVETWVFDLARRVDRLYAVYPVFVEHQHYQDYKAPFDATYQRHRMSREKSFADHARFLRTAPERERHARLLLSPATTAPEPAAAPDHRTVTSVTDQQSGTASYLQRTARRQYSSLIETWLFAGQDDEARRCAALAVEQGVWSHPLQRPKHLVPGLTARAVWDPAEFWFTSYLQECFPRIRAEVDRVFGSDGGVVRPDVADNGLLNSGSWEQARLFQDGRWREDVAGLFPVTRSVLTEIPEATTFNPGVVSISRVVPGTRIRPHCGPTNAVLRLHLGLRVPDGVSIRVADEIYQWQEGGVLVFDDSFEHQVWHRGTEDRTVLIIDLLHPELGNDDSKRLLAKRESDAEQVLAFMRERGLREISADGPEVMFRPDAPTGATVRGYMDATGSRGARVGAAGLELIPLRGET